MKNKNVSKEAVPFGKRVLGFVQNNSVPLMFVLICIICIPISGFSVGYLINEIVTRMGRNIFLILCLLFPIMAGMGLNFGMTLGAMAGEIALIFVADWQVWGIPGVVLAMILSVPFSVLLGMLCGKLLNMSKGREMITSYIISFFINGVYQLIVLYMMGSIIPIKHFSLKLPRGYGIRNTVSLLNMRQCVDNLLAVNIGGVKIPVLTFIIIALFCLFIVWFRKTKLGQDMRAVGQDMEVARDAGIKVERTRIISIVMSTVFSGFGMIIYLQNMGNIATYSSHSQIGMFCIAALLVGGAIIYLLSMQMFADMVALSFTLPASVGTAGIIAAGIGAVGIVLTSGRSSKSIGKRFLKGLYGLYGVSSYLSDILSYSRLLALGLATGVIASVFNQMGAMPGNNPLGVIIFIFAFVVGHTLNIGINVLGAYVHTNRLQFVEFFGKFFEGGGRKFAPFTTKTKYFKITEEK